MPHSPESEIDPPRPTQRPTRRICAWLADDENSVTPRAKPRSRPLKSRATLRVPLIEFRVKSVRVRNENHSTYIMPECLNEKADRVWGMSLFGWWFGFAENVVGAVTGDKEQQLKGSARETKGSAQQDANK